MSLHPTEQDSEPPSAKRTVLVTGASGRIGVPFVEHSHRKYALRLMVHPTETPKKIDALRPFGEVMPCDLGDLPRLKTLCRGIDTVLHLAGDPNPDSTWNESILPNNIIGAYNTFTAAKSAGCRRVIYASSIHAITGYPPDVQVKPDDPVNPGDLYGVSKCFGEALARYMAEQENVSAICIRIGAFQSREAAQEENSIGMVDQWVSHRDLIQLFHRCIDVEHLPFAIFHGLSDNRFKRMDITNARQILGYAPQDDLTECNPLLAAAHLKRNTNWDRGRSGLRNDL